MNDDNTMAEYLKRKLDHDRRKLKERVFLLEQDKIKELLSLYYIFCGCSKPYCEACQIVIDFKLTV